MVWEPKRLAANALLQPSQQLRALSAKPCARRLGTVQPPGRQRQQAARRDAPLQQNLAQGFGSSRQLAARARIRLTQQLRAPPAKTCARRLGLSRRLAANGSGLREATRPSSQTSRKVLGAQRSRRSSLRGATRLSSKTLRQGIKQPPGRQQTCNNGTYLRCQTIIHQLARAGACWA